MAKKECLILVNFRRENCNQIFTRRSYERLMQGRKPQTLTEMFNLECPKRLMKCIKFGILLITVYWVRNLNPIYIYRVWEEWTFEKINVTLNLCSHRIQINFQSLVCLFWSMQFVKRHIVLVKFNVLVMHVFDLFLQCMNLFRRLNIIIIKRLLIWKNM